MGGDEFLSALGSLTNALFLIASVYIYIALLRQIKRRDREVLATDSRFGVAEVALATFLIVVFGFSSLGASSVQIARLRTSDLILNAVVSIAIVLFVVAFLQWTVRTWLRSRVPPRSRTRPEAGPGTSLPSPDSQLPRGASVPPPVALAQREKGK